MLTRRALLPLLAGIPFRRPTPPEIVPRMKETRLVFGGDVMLSRFVGRLARARRGPASPLRDPAPLLVAPPIAVVNPEAPFFARRPPPGTGMVFQSQPR